MKRLPVLTAVALAATTLVTTAAQSAQAQTSGDRAVSAGSTWLKAQLSDGILHNDEYDYDDLGLTADVALALEAVGGHDATVVRIADAVAEDVTSWYDAFGTTYTGSAAKAVVLAQVAGKDANDFGGIDLQSVVEDNVATAAPIVGRVQNADETDWQTGEATDSLNVISQSWAARALAGQGSDQADEVMSFLLKQQCDAGFFRGAMTTDKTAPAQGCGAGDEGNVDTTALAVINILEASEAPAAAKGAAYLAANWLKTQQSADGSFAAGVLGTNANTTGLAGWALAEAGQDVAATKAAAWLRGVQVAVLAPCATALAADTGAIVYQSVDLATAQSAGSFSVPLRELARRATAQALPALAHVPAGTEVAVSAPPTAVEKSSVTVTVTGLGAGEPACVSLGGQAKQVAGTGSAVPVTFSLPAGVATHTFRVTTLAGSSTAITVATATPTPTPAREVGTLETARMVKVDGKRFTVALTCEGEVPCAGKLKVKTARKVALRSGTRVVTVAKRTYSVAPDREKELVLRLTKPGRALLGSGKLKVRAVQTAPDAERSVTRFWLKAAKG